MTFTTQNFNSHLSNSVTRVALNKNNYSNLYSWLSFCLSALLETLRSMWTSNATTAKLASRTSRWGNSFWSDLFHVLSKVLLFAFGSRCQKKELEAENTNQHHDFTLYSVGNNLCDFSKTRWKASFLFWTVYKVRTEG